MFSRSSLSNHLKGFLLNLIPVSLCAGFFILSQIQMVRAVAAENNISQEEIPTDREEEASSGPDLQVSEEVPQTEGSDTVTEEQTTDVLSWDDEITDRHVSVYIPEAWIITVNSPDGESITYTSFRRGRTLDYDVDQYIEEIDEITLFCQLVEAEAGNQNSLGRRLVADCVLNQLASGRYGEDIKSVIFVDNNYEVVETGAIFCVNPQESTKQCVENELLCQVDYGVMYFRTEHYHDFGIPFVHVDDLWFSKESEDESAQWKSAGTAEERGLITIETDK